MWGIATGLIGVGATATGDDKNCQSLGWREVWGLLLLAESCFGLQRAAAAATLQGNGCKCFKTEDGRY